MFIEDPDLLVVGAGIQGVGTAQAAAAAGQRVQVIEQRGVGWATSARSSKLIHGGLRYLETMQLSLVRESLAERRLLLKLAPHLVRLVPFHIPIYRRTRRRPLWIRAGLSLYALLGGLGETVRFRTLPRSDWDGLDGLILDDLQAVFRYFDGQTDDRALCRAVMESAIQLGAGLETETELIAARRVDGGWEARACGAGGEHVLRCRAIVNAAGPWVNRVLDRIAPDAPRMEIELVAGAHIELEGSLQRGIYYVEAPADGRAVFVMPWHGHVLVGTTERPYAADPADVSASAEEIDYLEGVFRHYFPQRPPRRISAWAGLRVLAAEARDPFRRPRDVAFTFDQPSRPSLISIYGGKLTGYRSTGEKVVRLLRQTLPDRARRADTRTLGLPSDPR